MDSKDRPTRHFYLLKWAPVLVLALALAIIIIDGTLLNVSFAYLIRDLNTDIQSLQWVITAYSLTLAALMITGGRLGDLFGRKRMFMLGAIIFAIGSFLASISRNVGMMIAGESIIEGVGAALMMPATASLLVSTYRGRDRAIAMGIWGGIAAAASAIGPILGGYLTSNFSWRWGFRINIFVAVLLLLGSVIIKECRDQEEKTDLDVAGVILSSTGLFAIVFGIIESSTYGWWKAKEIFSFFGHSLSFGDYSIVPVSLAIGIIILSVFVLWENHVCNRGKTPLVSFKIFQNSQFTAGALTTAIMALGQAGLVFSIPVFFQAVRGLDAYHTGLALLPTSLTALVVAPLSAIVSKKVAPKYLIQFGLLSATVAMFWVRATININTSAHDIIFPLILYGIGIGLTMAQLSNMTLSAVSVQEAGEASGLSNTLRQLGASLGAAVIGAALLTALAANLSKGIENSSIIPNQIKGQIASQVSAQTSNVEFGGGAKIAKNIPPAISAEIEKISKEATTDSNKLSLLYTALFNALGLFVAFWLPKTKNLEKNQSAAS